MLTLHGLPAELCVTIGKEGEAWFGSVLQQVGVTHPQKQGSQRGGHP